MTSLKKEKIENCSFCDGDGNYHYCGDCGQEYKHKGSCEGNFCPECEEKNLYGENYG